MNFLKNFIENIQRILALKDVEEPVPANQKVEEYIPDMIEPKREIPLPHTIILERKYEKNGTYGWIRFPSGVAVCCVERPWLDNQKGISCIPEGEYRLNYRVSPVVERSSGGEFTKGYEVANVPNRTFIMFHVGNWPLIDSDGCILVGKNHSFSKNQPTVERSRLGFREFMKLMEEEKIDKIIIKSL